MGEPLLKRKDFLHEIAQAYRRRQATAKTLMQGAEAPDDPQSTSDALASDGSSGIASHSSDRDDGSVTSQKSCTSLSSDPNMLGLRVHVMETVISNLFATVSSLEDAYVQLQSALEPYDPEKLLRADQAVICEFKKFNQYKHCYRERLDVVSSGQKDLAVLPEIRKKETLLRSYEGIISSFHSQISTKNIEIEKLKDMLAETTLKKEKLERRLKKIEQKVARESAANVSNASSPDFNLLESTVMAASETVKNFTKLLMTLMKLAEWDLDAAANSIHPGIHCERKNLRKQLFESYVWHRMLNSFENESFYVDGNFSSILDPEKHRQESYREFQELSTADVVEVIGADPDSIFGKFCLRKFTELIHPKMEESFFGNLEHRKQILNGKHPCSQFYLKYLNLAKGIWLVHRVAFSFEPHASIFQAKQDSEFSPMHMASVLQDVEVQLGIPEAIPKVGFTVMPGFRVGKAVLKCQVYLK